jgi:hypothetical protein
MVKDQRCNCILGLLLLVTQLSATYTPIGLESLNNKWVSHLLFIYSKTYQLQSCNLVGKHRDAGFVFMAAIN